MALSVALKNALASQLHGVGNAEEFAAYFASTTPGANAAVVCDANGNYYQSFKDTITAQHSSPSQSTATKLTAMINRITTVTAAADAVVLPASVAGLEIQVVNHGANPVQVYGASPDTINDIATATGVSQMQGSSVVYSCITTGSWYAEDLGVGYYGQYPTSSSTDNITAQDASPSQTTATPLTSVINRVVTIATTNDAVGLPAAITGMQITVINAHASNSVKVYTAVAPGSDVINALSSSTGYSVAATKTVTFFCCTSGQWHTLLSA